MVAPMNENELVGQTKTFYAGEEPGCSCRWPQYRADSPWPAMASLAARTLAHGLWLVSSNTPLAVPQPRGSL